MRKKKTFAIAIDGPSAAGKSTLAKKVANALNFTYIDTGAMYRCVALFCQRNGIPFEDEKAVESILSKVDIHLDNGKVFLNGEDVTSAIRANEMSKGASKVSKYVKVRLLMVKLQQKIAQKTNVVMDGRDIGTFVLPDAEIKIFLEANINERAHRRYLENIERGIEDNEQSILENLIQRDYEDSHRSFAPLKQAEDAILVDTSNLDREKTFEKVMQIISDKVAKLKEKEN